MNFLRFELGTEALLMACGVVFAGGSGSVGYSSFSATIETISGSVDQSLVFMTIIPVLLVVFFASAITHVMKEPSGSEEDGISNGDEKSQREKEKQKQT